MTDVTIERYAELRAEMEAGRLRDDVLARAGLTVDQWIDAQRAWLDQVARELTRGRFELTNRYAQVFLDRQRALTTTEAPALPEGEAPPIALPVPLPLAITPTRSAAPVIAMVETAPMPPLVARPAPSLAGTMNTDNSVFGPALPFQRGAAAPAIKAAPTPPVLPKVNRAPAELTGTRGVDLSALGPALPFAGGARLPLPAPPPPPPPVAPSPPAPQAAAATSPTLLGQTSPLDSWTVEQYASLCAEIAFNPAAAGETLGRYRVTSEIKAELDRRWKLRLSTDPALEAKWRTAYQTYVAFLGARR